MKRDQRHETWKIRRRRAGTTAIVRVEPSRRRRFREPPGDGTLEIREPVAVYDAEPEAEWSWDLALESNPYAIRLPEEPGWTRCFSCGVRFSAAGPTGHIGPDPICDLCLLESSKELGMVMALVAVTRTFGAYEPISVEDGLAAQAELGAFARIYERFAARSGPARVFRLPDPLSSV